MDRDSEAMRTPSLLRTLHLLPTRAMETSDGCELRLSLVRFDTQAPVPLPCIDVGCSFGCFAHYFYAFTVLVQLSKVFAYRSCIAYRNHESAFAVFYAVSRARILTYDHRGSTCHRFECR